MNTQTQIMTNRYQYGTSSVRTNISMEPISRTYQYRKIMKPMLERKRRARINKCLDELKDLMTTTLQADSENVSKLEKADILEMTVQHLQQLRERKTLYLYNHDTAHSQKFWEGFQRCAAEVAQFLHKHDQNINRDLIQNLTANYRKFPTLSVFQPQQCGLKIKPHKELSSYCRLQDNCKTLTLTAIPKAMAQREHSTDVWRPW